MTAQVLFFNDFSEKDLHLNVVEDTMGGLLSPYVTPLPSLLV